MISSNIRLLQITEKWVKLLVKNSTKKRRKQLKNYQVTKSELILATDRSKSTTWKSKAVC
jgi:ornithine carbamoyltransferase